MKPHHSFSADRPISSRREDMLGRSSFAESLSTSIKEWKGKDSLVIALYGAWGSGKTSVKNMILDSLNEVKETCPTIVEFNPWQWSGQEHLAEAFFHEIGLSLGRIDKSKEGKIRAAKWREYGTYLSLGASLSKSLKIVLPLLGVPDAGISDILAKSLGQSAGVSQEGAKGLDAQTEAAKHNLNDLKQEIAATLRTLKKPILVVVDDVDRLSADEIKFLFQLVKGNADFPNMVYLLLFQRDIVEKSLETIAPSSGKEFLEKIVQVGFDVPRIERSRLEKILFAGLDELLATEEVNRRFDQQRWGNIFLAGLRPYFQTLRDVHRYIATLSFHVSLFRNKGTFEVNPIDLIALEVLRVFEPEVYQRITESKVVLTEQRDSSSYGKDAEKEHRTLVEFIVDQSPEASRPQVREILQQLFPYIEWVFGGSRYGSGFSDEWFRNLRVCHPDIFDRYFHYTIPVGDISQFELDQILDHAGDREKVVNQLRALNKSGLLSVALDRLETYKEKIDLQYAVPFITAIFDIGDELPEKAPGFYAFGPEDNASRIIFWYLMREKDVRKRTEILKEAVKASIGLYLPVMRTQLEDSKQERKKDPTNFLVEESDLQDLKSICVNKIVAASESGLLRTHSNMINILYCWHVWVSPEESQMWVKKLIRTQDGLLSFLTAILNPSTSQGMGDYVPKIHWRISLKNIEDFVPVDIIEKKVNQLTFEQLGDKEQKAIRAFQKALKRRREGKSDDDWRRDDEEG